MLIPNTRTSAHYRLQADHIREFLNTVHNDDQLRSVLLDAATRLDRLAAETAYRLHFRDENGAQAREEFDASDDAAAISAAELVWRACAETCHAFELWQGDRLVFAFDEARANVAIVPTDHQPLDIQQITLNLEESLQRSHWLIARSERLISETQRLKERIKQTDQPEIHRNL